MIRLYCSQLVDSEKNVRVQDSNQTLSDHIMTPPAGAHNVGANAWGLTPIRTDLSNAQRSPQHTEALSPITDESLLQTDTYQGTDISLTLQGPAKPTSTKQWTQADPPPASSPTFTAPAGNGVELLRPVTQSIQPQLVANTPTSAPARNSSIPMHPQFAPLGDSDSSSSESSTSAAEGESVQAPPSETPIRQHAAAWSGAGQGTSIPGSPASQLGGTLVMTNPIFQSSASQAGGSGLSGLSSSVGHSPPGNSDWTQVNLLFSVFCWIFFSRLKIGQVLNHWNSVGESPGGLEQCIFESCGAFATDWLWICHLLSPTEWYLTALKTVLGDGININLDLFTVHRIDEALCAV
jgi:hypothetical protein